MIRPLNRFWQLVEPIWFLPTTTVSDGAS